MEGYNGLTNVQGCGWGGMRKLADLDEVDRKEWLQDWRDPSSNEFFVLGSRDETAGCQLCVARVADNGTLTLRLRMSDCLWPNSSAST